MSVVRPPTADLFPGIDDLINTRLGVTQDYWTKTANQEIVKRAPDTFDGEDFVQCLFERLRENWLRALPTAKASRQNFRWHFPQLSNEDRNANPELTLKRALISPEVTLERALVRASLDAGRKVWSNQVPVVSGIAGSRAYKRQAIDLVHRLPDGSFEFVELKIASDTPLYATIEVLLYGFFWLLSRQSKTCLSYLANPILDAPALYLSTLARATFYDGLTPSGFAAAIDSGVRALGMRHGVVMGFRQMAFPTDFDWPAVIGDRELLHWLDDREPIPTCA